MVQTCPDSCVSELTSDFEFSRLERPVFDVLPLCKPLAPWCTLLVPSGFYFIFFTLAFALTLGPRLAPFTFAIRLLACALACIAVSMKM